MLLDSRRKLLWIEIVHYICRYMHVCVYRYDSAHVWSINWLTEEWNTLYALATRNKQLTVMWRRNSWYAYVTIISPLWINKLSFHYILFQSYNMTRFYRICILIMTAVSSNKINTLRAYRKKNNWATFVHMSTSIAQYLNYLAHHN